MFHDPAIRPAGALLAGGASRRMGADKALLELNGRPMFRIVADALAWTEPRLQAGGAPLPGLGWPVVEDARPDAGPAAALEALLEHCEGRPVVVCATDLPFVDAELLRSGWRMAVEAAEVDPRIAAAVPRHRGRWHPLAATWMPAALEPIVRWLDAGHRRLQELLDELPVVAIEGEALASLGDPELLLANVNDVEDLRQARRLGAGD